MSGLWLENQSCTCSAETIARSGTVDVEGVVYCVYCRKRNPQTPPLATENDSTQTRPDPEPSNGEPVAAFCPMCGSKLLPEAPFCAGCGNPVAHPPAAASTQPAQPAASSPPQSPAIFSPSPATAIEPQSLQIDNTFAWALAFAPILLILLELVLASSTTTPPETRVWIQIVVAVALNSVLVFADWNRIRKANPDMPAEWWVSPWWGVLLVPVYLFLRCSKLKQSFAIPVVWCVCFVASIAVSAVAASAGVGTTSTIDSASLEKDIESYVLQQTGVSAQVTCPLNPPATVGSAFVCTASAGGQSIAFDVTVTGPGEVTWKGRV